MNKPRLIIFSSGSKDGGGSGFENLVKCSRNGKLNAKIVAAVSHHKTGGVRKRADRLGIPFVHFEGPYTADEYKLRVDDAKAEWVALSGWLKLVKGLDPKKTFNIHPGPLPRFGGSGMYGHHVHEAVMEAYRKGEVSQSAVSMHFVTEKYDEGPLFFQQFVPIRKDYTPETLGAKVNEMEHRWQPYITNLVVNRKISWDGNDSNTLTYPSGYRFHPVNTTTNE